MDIYYIDGQFIEEDKATLSVKDIIVLRGFGVFDFLVTYNKRPFHLKAHVARLEKSAREVGLTLGHSHGEICDIVCRTLEKNNHQDESNIRIVYTGGVSPDGVTPQGNGKLMVMVTPKHILPQWWYTDGAPVITVDMERFMPISKSTNYLTAVYAQQKARARGAVEALYVDRDNRVLEGTTTNIFGFKGKSLITPPDGILPGITRKVVLDLVKGCFPLEMRHIQKEELAGMDEVFISASNKEIVPIIRINDTPVGNGTPGTRTREVMALFREYTLAYGRGEVTA